LKGWFQREFEASTMTTQRAHYPAGEREILSMTEACQYLGVKRNTLLRLIREGKIPASKLRFRWRMKRSDIDYYVRRGKNPVAVEEEREKAREAFERPEKKAPSPRKEVLDPEAPGSSPGQALERLGKSSRPRRTLPTALLLKKAISILSENPCYLVGKESQTFMNAHLRDDGMECDLVAKGVLSEVLLRAADLFFTEELPPPSHRRQLLTLPPEPKSMEVVNEHLGQAIREAGLGRQEGRNLKHCADELFTNAMKASDEEVRVIIETGKEDVLFTVINAGQVEELPGKKPDPLSPGGWGIEMTKQYSDDFLLLSTNEKVIATARKARAAGKEDPSGQ
jgi:excisionase family DNA binding protein